MEQQKFIIENLESSILCQQIPTKDKDKLRDISVVMVSTILNKNYITGADMKAVFCLFQTLFTLLGKDKKDGLYHLSSEIQKWMLKLDILSSEGVQGLVYTASIFSPQIQVVIKVPKKKNGYSTMLREYFIGIKAINKLRYHLPTFIYTLGSFLCPLVKKLYLESLCLNGKKTTAFVIYEKIPGFSLANLLGIKHINFDTWLQIFVQILLSLELAQREVNFTHFDLHVNNIMIRENNIEDYTLSLDNYSYKIKNLQFLPVIIDFGFATAVIDEKIIGSFDFPQYGMINFCVPGYDMYKLLCSSYQYANNIVKSKIREIFRFYDKNDPYDIFAKGNKGVVVAMSEYCANVTYSKAATYTPLMLLKWIAREYSPILSKYIEINRRVNYITLQYSNVLQQYNKIFSKSDEEHEQFNKILTKCFTLENSYILSSYIIHIISKYNIELSSKEFIEKIKIMKQKLIKFSVKFILFDKTRLNNVFLIKLPKQDRLKSAREDVLNIPIRYYNSQLKKKVILNLYSQLEYEFRLQGYLQFYYTILELKIEHIFREWLDKFVISPLFIFYNNNVLENSQALRWARDTLSSSMSI